MFGVFSAFAFVIISLSVIAAGSFYIYVAAFRADEKAVEEDLIFPGESEFKIGSERIRCLVGDIYNTPYEEITIEAYDGLTLYGKYYHFCDGAPLDIQFHGYRSVPARDCCGTFRISRDMGHNILLVDQRAHGKSGGKVITFGIRERYDCVSWVNYAVSRFGKNQKIILIGLSMGAATVLMAASLKLPENVLGIIADSTYSSPREILLKVCADRRIPIKIADLFASFGALLFGRFNLDEITAEKAAKSCTKPVLFFHGSDDYFVPSRMSRKVYAACASKKHIVILQNGGHCAGYVFNTERYIKEISEFYGKIVGENS